MAIAFATRAALITAITDSVSSIFTVLGTLGRDYTCSTNKQSGANHKWSATNNTHRKRARGDILISRFRVRALVPIPSIVPQWRHDSHIAFSHSGSRNWTANARFSNVCMYRARVISGINKMRVIYKILNLDRSNECRGGISRMLSSRYNRNHNYIYGITYITIIKIICFIIAEYFTISNYW